MIQFIKDGIESIRTKSISFGETLRILNRVIINLNNNCFLYPEIKRFSIQELAKVTLSGFHQIYNMISRREMDIRFIKDQLNLRNIEINKNTINLDANERAEICKTIIDSIDTTDII